MTKMDYGIVFRNTQMSRQRENDFVRNITMRLQRFIKMQLVWITQKKYKKIIIIIIMNNSSSNPSIPINVSPAVTHTEGE